MQQITAFKQAIPNCIISENGINGAGEVVCCCGNQFSHNLNKNMKEHMGFVYPVCPECGIIPASETRQIDL